MTAPPGTRRIGRERGFTLLELMTALIVLTVGILAVARLFPAGVRGQTQDRLQATAGYLAQAEIERLCGLAAADPAITAGRHPASGWTACGPSSHWQRAYTVTAMAAPMSDVKSVSVTVTWPGANGRDVTLTTYVGQ